MIKQEYLENIPPHNLHFIMGTMKAHPQTLIVVKAGLGSGLTAK